MSTKLFMAESRGALTNPTRRGALERILVWRTEREEKGDEEERKEGREGGKEEAEINSASLCWRQLDFERNRLLIDALRKLASCLFFLPPN